MESLLGRIDSDEVAAPALEKVKEFWNFKSDQFENETVQTVEIDDDEDIIVNDDSEISDSE